MMVLPRHSESEPGSLPAGDVRLDRSLCRHGGMVMIELVAVIAVTAMLFGVVMALFTAAYRLEAAWRGEAAERRELQRLADYFRHDAHRAIDLDVAEDGRSWTFDLSGGGRATYDLLDGAVRRTAQGGSNSNTSTEKQQQLNLPEEADLNLRETSIAQRRIMTLIVQVRPSEADAPKTKLRVDADLGCATAGLANQRTNEGSR